LLVLQLARNIADKTGRRWLCPCKLAHVQKNQGWTIISNLISDYNAQLDWIYW